MGNIIQFTGKTFTAPSATPHLQSALALGKEPIDIDAKFIAYAIIELTSEQRALIKADPLLTAPIEEKLKKLGWPMEQARFVEAYTHLINSMRNISD